MSLIIALLWGLHALLHGGLCTNTAFIQEVVDRHNYWRAVHGVPDLVNVPEMNDFAQAWADNMAATGNFGLNPDQTYGQNVQLRSASNSASDFVDNLYTDGQNVYDENGYYGNEPTSYSGILMFTAVVWKSTQRIGVGTALSPAGGRYVVTVYDPKGNYLNQFAANVLEPGSTQTSGTTAEPTTTLSPEAALQAFRDSMVARHNELRAVHGAGALTEDPAISTFAQNYVEQMAASENFAHNPDTSYGENIAYTSSPQTGAYVTNLWYTSEENYYSTNNLYGTEPNSTLSGEYGHFTAIVWKNTNKIGIGRATGASGKVYVVANYYPAGNVIGQFTANVGAP